jgi:hypothetical protein
VHKCRDELLTAYVKADCWQKNFGRGKRTSRSTGEPDS